MKKLNICLFMLLLFAFLSGQSTALAIENNAHIKKPIRAYHFALRHLSLQEGYKLVDRLKNNQFNLIQVMLTTGVKFKNSPWNADDSAWSAKDFGAWVMYARKHGLEVVPEVKLLTHQERHFFQGNFPELMYEKDTYDPSNDKVYKKVFALLSEIIDLIHPVAIHIGHDELTGWKKESEIKSLFKSKEKMLPAKLFLADVLKVHGFLALKGVETWMWGDMLVSEHEAPNMNKLYLHGDALGYGESMRKKLPKDILICDWHYRDKKHFESLRVLQESGFRVIGVTWKDDENIASFSKYAAKHKAYGMMASTWYFLNGKRHELVDHIMEFSGETFLKDFPDEK